ncbi:MAG: aspartate carbamoyltransferase regulatory subunit [archaeon]|jgi:aspartate carbamoyltransferase regulatory subunit
MSERKVGTISNGVVIDHIVSGKANEIAKILNLNQLGELVVIANNLESKKTGKKDLIKIENKELSQEELNKIALISKDSTINIIRNSSVFKKYPVVVPDVVENILVCNNPNCISNHEKISSKFYCLDKSKITLKCHYCEKKQNEIKIK